MQEVTLEVESNLMAANKLRNKSNYKGEENKQKKEMLPSTSRENVADSKMDDMTKLINIINILLSISPYLIKTYSKAFIPSIEFGGNYLSHFLLHLRFEQKSSSTHLDVLYFGYQHNYNKHSNVLLF